MLSPASFVYSWDNQLRYALALLDDVTDEQFVTRPGGNMNHPAWIIGHVSLYHDATLSLLAGKPFKEPKDDPLFGYDGDGPIDDIEPYGSKQLMVERFADSHEVVAQAVLSASPADFARAPSLPRWAAMYPTVEFLLPDLLLFHEGMHIGQISTWRRAMGLAGVEFPDRTPRPGLAPSPARN
ncbi:MAG: DinB family protein [Planctomycetota bacterium]